MDATMDTLVFIICLHDENDKPPLNTISLPNEVIYGRKKTREAHKKNSTVRRSDIFYFSTTVVIWRSSAMNTTFERVKYFRLLSFLN